LVPHARNPRTHSEEQIAQIAASLQEFGFTNFLRRIWHKVQDIAKVRRRTPHDCRHSWASHMLASGADLAYVSNQPGHANPSITLRIYSHWVPGMRRVTTAVLDTDQNASKMQMQAAEAENENFAKRCP
jgi:integrase